MPVHDAVGLNYKNGTTTEYQGKSASYMSYGVYALSDLILLPIIHGGRRSWHISINITASFSYGMCTRL